MIYLHLFYFTLCNWEIGVSHSLELRVLLKCPMVLITQPTMEFEMEPIWSEEQNPTLQICTPPPVTVNVSQTTLWAPTNSETFLGPTKHKNNQKQSSKTHRNSLLETQESEGRGVKWEMGGYTYSTRQRLGHTYPQEGLLDVYKVLFSIIQNYYKTWEIAYM